MPAQRRIVLAGGGHANALALLRLAGGGALTLLSDGVHTPYSGMLPGYIAGSYRREQCFINLQQTAAACGAEFINARVCGLNGRELLLADGRRLAFDVLSLNVGANQPPPPSAAAAAAVCTVKPIAAFIRWLAVQDSSDFRQLAMVGGGAGGIETILALAHRWRHKAPRPALTLVSRHLLPAGSAAMRRHVRRRLAASGIGFIQAQANAYDGEQLALADAAPLPVCRVLYSTPVVAAGWFADTGLPLDAGGFLRVNHHLQSPASAAVFISGDAAGHSPPLPKAGVMAVRQSRVLAHNLPVVAGWRTGKLKVFNNTARALFIIGDGDGSGAVASRNGLTVSGKWVWRWKQHLDFKFMSKFSN